ncbi:hypothetical protein DFP73DRAFT_551463 [Morchella snyderi]|nr:hypothetical protein DFP73DRAFT_551463 [Morchella snyderi]
MGRCVLLVLVLRFGVWGLCACFLGFWVLSSVGRRWRSLCMCVLHFFEFSDVRFVAWRLWEECGWLTCMTAVAVC